MVEGSPNQLRASGIKSHLVGDMGVALCRYWCGKMGFIYRELSTLDYGVDGLIEIVSNGSPTGQLIAVQVKCSDKFVSQGGDDQLSFRYDERQRNYWTKHQLPVIGVLANHIDMSCFWGLLGNTDAGTGQKTYTAKISTHNRFDETSAQAIAALATPPIGADRAVILQAKEAKERVFRSVALEISLQNSPASDSEIEMILRQQISMLELKLCRSEHGSRPVANVYFDFTVYEDRIDKDLGIWRTKAVWVGRDVPRDNINELQRAPGLTVAHNQRHQEARSNRQGERDQYSQYLELYNDHRKLLHDVFREFLYPVLSDQKEWNADGLNLRVSAMLEQEHKLRPIPQGSPGYIDKIHEIFCRLDEARYSDPDSPSQSRSINALEAARSAMSVVEHLLGSGSDRSVDLQAILAND